MLRFNYVPLWINFLAVCAKCGQSKDLVESSSNEQEKIKLDEEMKALLKSLPERKRRTFIRYMNKKVENPEVGAEGQRTDILDKLKSLKVNDDDDDDEFDGLFSDESDFDSHSCSDDD